MASRNNFSESNGRRQTSNASADERILRDELNSRPAPEDELAYRDGYAQAREDQIEQIEEVQQTREANSVGAGAIIGVLMATVAGLVLAMLYLTPRQQTVAEPTGTQVAPVVAPGNSIPTNPVPSAAPITPTQPQVGTVQPASPVPNQVPSQVPNQVPNQVTGIEPAQQVPVGQPSTLQFPAQPPVAQPQITQPPIAQPQIPQPVSPQTNPQPQLVQPVQPFPTNAQTEPLVPSTTSPTDPYQSPQPSVITPPGTVGQP